MKQIVKVNERFIAKVDKLALKIKPRSASILLKIFDFFTKKRYSRFFTVFTFVNTLYVPNREISKERAFEVLVHEYFHLVQSKNYRFWNLKYLLSQKFRAKQELEAYMFEYFMVYIRDYIVKSDKEFLINFIQSNYMINKKHLPSMNQYYVELENIFDKLKTEMWSREMDPITVMGDVISNYKPIFREK